MNRSKLRSSPVVAVLIAALFVIAACGNEDPAPSAAPAAQDAQESDAATADGPLEDQIVPGSKFLNPWNEGPAPSAAEIEEIAASFPDRGPVKIEGDSPPRVESFVETGVSTQGEEIGVYGVSSYKGMPTIYQYTNYDGSITCCNCGQAAVATVLRAAGHVKNVKDIEHDYKPDVNNGKWGTWPGTLRNALYNLTPTGWDAGWYHSETTLRNWVAAGNPAIVLLDLGAIPGQPWWAGHYTVVFGYDTGGYYMTNLGDIGDGWNYLTNSHFRAAWKATIPQVAGVANKWLALYRR